MASTTNSTSSTNNNANTNNNNMEQLFYDDSNDSSTTNLNSNFNEDELNAYEIRLEQQKVFLEYSSSICGGLSDESATAKTSANFENEAACMAEQLQSTSNVDTSASSNRYFIVGYPPKIQKCHLKRI